MRLLVVSALAVVLFLYLGSCCAGATGTPDPSSTSVTARPLVDQLDTLVWPAFFFVGYISISLKQQIRRRGYLDGRHSESYSDLIFLRPKNPPTPPADTGNRPDAPHR
jgi:hypothetical protein